MYEFGSSRVREDDMYDIIREQDDGSQYLNDSGDGMFEEQPTDQGHTQNNDDEENALQLTKFGEVYIGPLMISLHVVIDLALIN